MPLLPFDRNVAVLCSSHYPPVLGFFFPWLLDLLFMHQKSETMGALRTVQLLLFHACAEGSHDTSLAIIFLQFPFAFKLS